MESCRQTHDEGRGGRAGRKTGRRISIFKAELEYNGDRQAGEPRDIQTD